MKTFKKSLSLILAVCILASMAVIASVSASANAGDPVRRPLITEFVNKGDEVVETNTYYFYMPNTAQWRNEFNDYYDGTEGSYAAGLYWWDGAYKPEDAIGVVGVENAWPGYAVTEKEEADANIFKAQVPNDVPKIIWNNLVDGGTDNTQPQYTKAAQTVDIPSEYYDPNEEAHGFYPDGTESFDGMIFVPNPKEVSINPLSQKETIGGAWCYYYGDGTYGIYPTKAEAEAAGECLSGGQFPNYGLQADWTEIEFKVGDSETVTPNDSSAVATIADTAVATVTQDPVTGVATVTGVGAGKTTLTFTLAKEGSAEEKIDIPVTVIKPETKITLKAAKSTIYVKGTTTVKATVTNGSGKTTYNSSNTKVATVDSKGKVTAKKAGKVTITATNNKKSAKATITVKNPTVKISAKTVKVKKTVKFTVKNAVGKTTYKTSNKKIATVSAKGVVKGVKAGKATITVTASGVKFTFKVTVKK